MYALLLKINEKNEYGKNAQNNNLHIKRQCHVQHRISFLKHKACINCLKVSKYIINLLTL